MPATKSEFRLATLRQLRADVLPEFFGTEIPSDGTLRKIFASGGIAWYKPNREADRGGGPIRYRVADVIQLLTHRITRHQSEPLRESVQAIANARVGSCNSEGNDSEAQTKGCLRAVQRLGVRKPQRPPKNMLKP